MRWQGDEPAKAKAAYLHHDPLLGSVVAVSGAGGALKEAFYYEPFGQRTDKQGKPLTSALSEVGSGFTGQEHDEDFGLINFRGRIYDPVIRRFLSADPHVTHPLSGQSYNRYSYVVNDPTNLIDPTGFDDIGQEYGGWGTGYSSDGFESTYGNDYSGCFTRVDGPTPYRPSGFSGSASSANGAGAPVQAVERQRQVSMPTGPSAPAGAISGPVAKADTDADKWNPYSDEGRIHQALFGAEPPLQDPLTPYGPAMASIGVSFIPGLNSYMVLNDPEASTAGKVLAVGSDVLSVVGVGTVLKLGAKGAGLAKGLVVGAEAVEGVALAEGKLAAAGMQAHHLFPQAAEFAPMWNEAGINIEHFRVQLLPETHLGQLHSAAGIPHVGSGGLWNATWRVYFAEEAAAGRAITKEGLFRQLGQMTSDFEIPYFSPLTGR